MFRVAGDLGRQLLEQQSCRASPVRGQPGLVVLQMQRDPGRPFCGIGVPGEDRRMLVVGLREAQLAAMRTDLAHQVAVNQILVQLTPDRLGLGKRQYDAARLVGGIFDRRGVYIRLDGLTALGDKQRHQPEAQKQLIHNTKVNG